MHELGIITGVLEAAEQSAREAGATKILGISLSIGEMTEVIEEALVFSFEALTEINPYLEGAVLDLKIIQPKSRCLECGNVFNHGRLEMFCPQCDSFALELLEGRELNIDSIEVELPDKDEHEN